MVQLLRSTHLLRRNRGNKNNASTHIPSTGAHKLSYWVKKKQQNGGKKMKFKWKYCFYFSFTVVDVVLVVVDDDVSFF